MLFAFDVDCAVNNVISSSGSTSRRSEASSSLVLLSDLFALINSAVSRLVSAYVDECERTGDSDLFRSLGAFLCPRFRDVFRFPSG